MSKSFRLLVLLALLALGFCPPIVASGTRANPAPAGPETLGPTFTPWPSGKPTRLPTSTPPPTRTPKPTCAPRDDEPAEVDPATFSPVGELKEEQVLQNYTIRLYSTFPDCFSSSFEILRDGTRVYARTGFMFYIGADNPYAPSLPVVGRDINGDGMPDLVVAEYSGGAHCCLTFYLFELGPSLREIATLAVADEDKAHFADLDGDANLELVTADQSWAYAWTSFAASPAPKVVLRYRDGAYHLDADVMRRPAPTFRELLYRAEQVRSSPDWQGRSCALDLPWYLLDLVYSGHAGLAREFLDMAWAPGKEGKEGFARHFYENTLPESPYWPEVRALSSEEEWARWEEGGDE